MWLQTGFKNALEPSAMSYSQPQDFVQPQRQQLTDEELVRMLVRSSIDPALLSPTQVDLFRNADYDQRLRLLELWRIAPLGEAYILPQTVAREAETNLRSEEELAGHRYELRMLERQMSSRSNDNAMAESSTSPTVELVRPSSAPPESKGAAEPYMMSGYEMLVRRDYETQAQATSQPLQESTRYNQATDPSYKGSANPGLWQKADVAQDMENAYGNYEAMRDMEGSGLRARNGLDDEMIM